MILKWALVKRFISGKAKPSQRPVKKPFPVGYQVASPQWWSRWLNLVVMSVSVFECQGIALAGEEGSLSGGNDDIGWGNTSDTGVWVLIWHKKYLLRWCIRTYRRSSCPLLTWPLLCCWVFSWEEFLLPFLSPFPFAFPFPFPIFLSLHPMSPCAAGSRAQLLSVCREPNTVRSQSQPARIL